MPRPAPGGTEIQEEAQRDRAFSVAASKLWSNVSLHIREASSLSAFKTCFDSQAFDPRLSFSIGLHFRFSFYFFDPFQLDFFYLMYFVI